jgi:Protein of unknown function (DUF3102)
MSDVIVDAKPEKVDRRGLAAALKAVGNLKKVSVPRAAVTPRSIDEWAKVIAGDLTRAVEGIIAAGQHLQEAKAEVDHGDWLPLLKRLKMGASTAARLMRIAENKVLRNSAHWAKLPASWRTLYQMTTLPPDTLEAKLAQNVITREITREEVRALCSDRRDQRDRLKRVPHTALITSWDQVVKCRDIVRHNLDVKTRRYQRWGEDPEDRLNHEPTVAAMIMVSPDDVQELDRYVELHTGTSRRELMEEAVMTLCEALRRARKEHEERIEREQRQKYEAAMTEKRPREALGDGVA